MAGSAPLPFAIRRPPFAQSGRTHTLWPSGCAVDVPTRFVSDRHAHCSPAGWRVRQPSGAPDGAGSVDGGAVRGGMSGAPDGAGVVGAVGSVGGG